MKEEVVKRGHEGGERNRGKRRLEERTAERSEMGETERIVEEID